MISLQMKKQKFHVRICVRKTFQNVLKWIKIRKDVQNENPLIKRGFMFFEGLRKLGGKFYESRGREFESLRAYHSFLLHFLSKLLLLKINKDNNMHTFLLVPLLFL